MYKLQHDKANCIGCGACEAVAGDFFEMKEDGKSQVKGGKKLDTFARVAGISAKEFATLWKKDATEAFQLFIKGLDRIRKSGGSVFKTLESLGMTEVRLRDAMLRLSGAGDLLSRSIDKGNKAFAENIWNVDE